MAGWTDFVGNYWLCRECKPDYTPAGTAQDRQYIPQLREQVTAIEARRKHLVELAKTSGCKPQQLKEFLELLDGIERLEMREAALAQGTKPGKEKADIQAEAVQTEIQ
jgi:hypothetical protein